jgi:trk system potassium uptake protein TrkH
MVPLFSVCLVVDIIYGDIGWSNFLTFTLPLVTSMLLLIPHIVRGEPERSPRKGYKYKIAMGTFVYIVLLSSLPFMISGFGMPPAAIFESTAGLTTTGLSIGSRGDFLELSRGLLFFRCAIQWVGGIYYLVLAFMILTDINDLAKRSVDQRMLSRIGVVPRLGSLLTNIAILYVLFTFVSFILLSITGMPIYDALCQSLGTVSGGGFGANGRYIDGGIGLHMLLVPIMIMAGVGYYVHMSVFSARGRMKSLFDTENIFYWTAVITAPVLAVMILSFSNYSVGESVWKGIFSAVSALTTTGFMIEGMSEWPDSLRYLLLLLMLLGGSSLSVASGLKMQRILLLTKGFMGEVERSSHPRAVITLRRGTGTYSENALEAATVTFFYLFGALSACVLFLLIFHEGIMDVISLSVTAISNGGIAYGQFSGPEGISSLNWAPKLLLVLVMFLGRFDFLLPLYFLTPRTYRFSG